MERVLTLNERVMVFIDGSNLYKSLKNLSDESEGEVRIAFERFLKFLINKRQFIRVYYYISVPPKDKDPENYEKQNKFAKVFQQVCTKHWLNHKVRFTTLKVLMGPGGEEKFIEKGVDVKISTDMLSLAYKNAYDTAILISGDSDFHEVIEEVQRQGKVVEVAFFERECSQVLKEVADKFIPLEENLDKFRYVDYHPEHESIY